MDGQNNAQVISSVRKTKWDYHTEVKETEWPIILMQFPKHKKQSVISSLNERKGNDVIIFM